MFSLGRCTFRSVQLLLRCASVFGLLSLASIASAQVPALANISTRTRVEAGDNVLIAGLIITGDAPKRRADLGPGGGTDIAGSNGGTQHQVHRPAQSCE